MENEIEFLEPFSQEENDVIYRYKTAEDEFAYQLNAYLRGNIVYSPPSPVWICHLDSAIKKCRTTKEITLYRATCSEDFDRFIRNDIFMDPAFASTSLNENSLSTFFNSMNSKKPIKLVISCPSGANMIDMELEDDSDKSENEILLPRCSHYKIKNCFTIIDKTKIVNEIKTSIMNPFNDYIELKIYEVKLVV